MFTRGRLRNSPGSSAAIWLHFLGPFCFTKVISFASSSFVQGPLRAHAASVARFPTILLYRRRHSELVLPLLIISATFGQSKSRTLSRLSSLPFFFARFVLEFISSLISKESSAKRVSTTDFSFESCHWRVVIKNEEWDKIKHSQDTHWWWLCLYVKFKLSYDKNWTHFLICPTGGKLRC